MHNAGDALLAQFTAVLDALSCAVFIQNELQTQNKDLTDVARVKFRIGVNSGDVIEDRGDIYGDGVNVAAWLETLAEPGGICISDAVRTAIGNKLPCDYVYIGEQRVKNIDEPVRTYRVFAHGTTPATSRRELSEYEQEYRDGVKARYAEDAAYYIPLAGETSEVLILPIHSPRSARRRTHRAK